MSSNNIETISILLILGAMFCLIMGGLQSAGKANYRRYCKNEGLDPETGEKLKDK